MNAYTRFTVLHLGWMRKLLHIEIRHFWKPLKGTCHFEWPKKDVMLRYLKVVKSNMKANGPLCTIKRWWFYHRYGAFHIDINSSLFT